MNIAVIDDMPDEISAVKKLLKEYAALNRFEAEISEFSSAEAFLKDYFPLQYAVIFMDIYMNGMTGVEAVRIIRETDSNVIIVFLTTSEDHRADAFSCHAYDYLIKPVLKESLFRTMDDILKTKTVIDRQKFMFSSQRRNYSIPYADIVFIRTETAGSNYLELVDRSGNSYRIRMTFSAVCKSLADDNRFLPVQAGTIVNMEHIIQMKDKCCIMSVREGGTDVRLPYSIKKEKEIKRIWQNFMFESIRNQSLR